MGEMHIFLLEPFFGGSHAAWAKGYAQHSLHQVSFFTLRDKYWKWRMQGGAVALADQCLAQAEQPDLLLATDMLDLCTFLALTRHQVGRIPVGLYFHENQLTYPWSPSDPDRARQRDRHYAFINYRSALAADVLCFNSGYHLDSFHAALPDFLRAFPDQRGLHHLTALREKSYVLPLGLDLQALDAHRPAEPLPPGPPLILWNHRWEYDKNPEAFFQALFQLSEQGLDFRLAVLGEGYPRSPAIFAEAKTRLSAHIAHWGYAADRADYVCWLWHADLLPVTAQQDFFGISVVEAAYCHTRPLLPQRLAYPEHFPDLPGLYYDPDRDLIPRLAEALTQPQPALLSQVRQAAARYDWAAMVPRYDHFWADIAKKRTDQAG